MPSVAGSTRKIAGNPFEWGEGRYDVQHPNAGAKGDARYVLDGAITTGTPNFTSATGAFTVADVGKGIAVEGAGAAGVPLVTTILAYVSGTAVTLAANASATVAAATTVVGTNDTAAFVAARDAAGVGGTVVVRALRPGCVYRIDGEVAGLSDQTWFMRGVRIVTLGSTVTTFNWDTVNDWSMIGPFRIIGGGSTIGTAKAVRLRDCARWRINDPAFLSIKGHGIYMEPGGSTRQRGEGGTARSPMFKSCYKGWEDVAGTGAEYCTVDDIHATLCTIFGLQTSAGNTRFKGGQVIDNIADGVSVVSGGNHAHGGFDGLHSNHNPGYNWRFTLVTNGLTLMGCHSYALNNSGSGSIYFDRCKGIVWNGGIIDGWVYCDKDGSSGQNIIRNAYCPGGYGDITLTFGGTDGREQLWFDKCFGAGAYTTGVTINDPSPVYVYAQRSVGATQALTSGIEATLVFDVETFDRRNAFVPSTGIFTVPAGQAGMYRLRATLYFAGTAMNAPASYAQVKLNGTSRTLHLPSIFGTTILTIPIITELYLNVGDTLKITGVITGTTPTFGGATWANDLAIERIS